MYRLTLFFTFYFLLFTFYFSFAQNKEGKVEIIADSKLDELVNKHKELNENFNGIPGYRVQIYSESGTNSKNKAENNKEDFLKKFNDEAVYILFQEPNYKVRVGDFRTQLDALGYLHKIQPFFPNAFIVADKINFPKL